MKKILISLFFLSFCSIAAARTQTVILPAKFQDNPVLVIDSPQYKTLLSVNKNLAAQFDKEKITNQDLAKQIDTQAAKNAENQNKLVTDYQKLQVDNAEKDSAILRRDILIGVLSLLIAGYIATKLYLKSSLFGL